MEEGLDIQTPINKVYSDKEIFLATFLGGPLAAGYLISENFKAFNQPDKAKKSLIYSILGTIVIFGIIFFIPENVKIPNQVFPIIYVAITYSLVKHFQEKDISAHLNAGGQLQTWWKTIAVGLTSLTITLIAIFGFSFMFDNIKNAQMETKTYGTMKHEIAFNKNNISIVEIDKLADAFTETTFFDEAVTKYVYARKHNNIYEISISCVKSVTEDLQPYIDLKNEMQSLIGTNKIIFKLVVDHLDNVVKQIE